MKNIVNILSVEDRRGTRQTTKILTRTQEKTILTSLGTTRYPARERVTFLLLVKSGL